MASPAHLRVIQHKRVTSSSAQPGDPAAPYGRDAATGEPLSNKFALAAGALQLFFGWFGVGRFYIGSTTVGMLQLVSTLIGVVLYLFYVGIIVMFAVSVWVFIDAIMMFAGIIRDGSGRKLRPPAI
jgi:TM2 domain-containing membrane protein YozV